MALTVGTRLGHYDVTALLGEGGMGQVWQATDTQLGREVALKILPDAFADDPDRLARFKQEAQILASLNHPNIAQIHGIEEAEGTRALVLELVEGPTLADRIAKGPIPLDEALPIAKQIAEALEAAHEAGVIHRDLKPANVKVREDGTVKVLDFGLAKAIDPNPEGDPSQSPTLTAAARGKPVDKRADIWAFGCVLYEMLAGRRAFGGADVSETLVSVLRDAPDWSSLPDDVRPAVRQAIDVCLRKDRAQRVRDLSAVRLALDGAFDTSVAHGPGAHPDTAMHFWQRPAAIVAMLALVAAATGLEVWRARTAPPGRRVQFAITSLSPLAANVPAANATLSPDGRRIVFTSDRDGGGPYWKASDGTGQAERLGERLTPFSWSADGQTIAFNRGTPETGADIGLLSIASGEVEMRYVGRSLDGIGFFDHDYDRP